MADRQWDVCLISPACLLFWNRKEKEHSLCGPSLPAVSPRRKTPDSAVPCLGSQWAMARGQSKNRCKNAGSRAGGRMNRAEWEEILCWNLTEKWKDLGQTSRPAFGNWLRSCFWDFRSILYLKGWALPWACQPLFIPLKQKSSLQCSS